MPFAHHVALAERRLVETLLLRPIQVPARFGVATGLWKDERVSITTRAYEGDVVSYLRVALVHGSQFSIASLLGLPRPNRVVPLLTAALEWSGTTRETIVAADLPPVAEGDEADAARQAVALAIPDVWGLPPGGEHPHWSARRPSPAALYTRVSADRLPDAVAAFQHYVEIWIQLCAGAVPSPERADLIRARQRRFIESHRADDAIANRLATMFGRAWTDDYVRTILFPGD